MSSSHGISWDELDSAYVNFAKAGKKQYDEWARGQGEQLPEAAKVKKRAETRAIEKVGRFCPPGENPLGLYPGRVKRLASKYYKLEKKKRLDAWRPGRLTSHLQQLVVARMLRRETSERIHDFGR